MVSFLRKGKCNAFAFTILFALVLTMGTNINIANASNQSLEDKASALVHQQAIVTKA